MQLRGSVGRQIPQLHSHQGTFWAGRALKLRKLRSERKAMDAVTVDQVFEPLTFMFGGEGSEEDRVDED